MNFSSAMIYLVLKNHGFHYKKEYSSNFNKFVKHVKIFSEKKSIYMAKNISWDEVYDIFYQENS